MCAFSRSLTLAVAAFLAVQNSLAADGPDNAVTNRRDSQSSETSKTDRVQEPDKPVLDPQATLQLIVDEWEKRRERYHSVDVTFTLTTDRDMNDPVVLILNDLGFAPKSKPKKQNDRDDIPVGQPPQEDIVREEELWRLLIDGPRSRTERNILSPKPKIWISVDDGKEVSELISFVQLKNGLPYPYAFVRVSENPKLLVTSWPIFFSFPGLKRMDPTIDPKRLKLRDQGDVIDGIDCFVAEHNGGVDGTHQLWIAPQMGFSILRCVGVNNGQKSIQLDCRYQQQSGLWVPDCWTMQWLNGAGKPRSVSQMKVLKCDLKPTGRDSDFELDFPVGTVVTDSRYDKKNGHSYLVAPDGDQLHPTTAKVIELNSGKWAKGIDVPPTQKSTSDATESPAASKIQLLGGKLQRDPSDVDPRIIGVHFGRDSRFRDKYLPLLKDLPDLTELSFSDPQITDDCLQTLKEFKKLTALTLWEPDLTIPRLKLLGDLQSLTSLSIYGGRIADDGLEALNALKLLQHLHIERTTLTAARLEDLRELTELRELRLIKCGLMPNNLTGLAGFNWLTKLDLSNSRVTDEGLQHLSKFQHLQELIIPSTGMSDAGLKELRDLHKLTRLDIRRSHTTDKGLKELAGLTHLTHLNLASTKITNEGLKGIAEHRHLTMLDVSGCEITDAGLVHLKQLSNLTWLGLRNTPITADGLKELQTLQGMTHLELAGKSTTDAAIKVIKEFKNLKELSLYYTNITDASLEELSQFSGLAELNLSRTQLSAAGFAYLRTAMPKTQILGGELPEEGAERKTVGE